MDFLAVLLAFLLGYLFGSIPVGVIVGKLIYKKDPRDYGSHNSGGTNAGRVFGTAGGILVILLDMAKTLIPFYLFYILIVFTPMAESWGLFDNGELATWVTILGATIGHCYSLFLRGGGGKAVSCFMAGSGGTSYVGFGIALVSFFASLAFKKKVVSFASLVSGGIITLFEMLIGIVSDACQWNSGILMWDFGASGYLGLGWQSAVVLALCYLVLVVKHIPNIKRLRAGEEKPAHWGK